MLPSELITIRKLVEVATSGLVKSASRADLPFRNRVEVVITDGLNVYAEKHPLSEGGLWFPGGGVDYAEKFGDAAAREAVEETGIKVSDIYRAASIPPIEALWQKEDASRFEKERWNQYQGDRTFFYIATADRQIQPTTDEGDEMNGEWLPLNKALTRLNRAATVDDGTWAKLTKARRRIVRELTPNLRKAPRRS